MGMVVRTNMAALNANNSLAQASKAQQNGMAKLASGFKINKAADDASGLAISEKMKNQIKALDTAKDNCEDGANLIQTAEGYMSETQDMLNRMVELSEKAANGTLGDEDRSSLQDEMDQLCGEIDRIATTANFNGHKLLDGSLGNKGAITLTSDPKTGKVTYNSPSASGGIAVGQLSNATASKTVNAFAVSASGGTISTANANLKATTGAQGTYTSKGVSAAGGKGINLQIGESSTSADRINVKIDSFHTDTLFSGLAGFINTSNDNTETKATAQLKLRNNFSGSGGNATATAAFNSTDGKKLYTSQASGAAGASTYSNAVSIDISDMDSASAAADALRQISNYVSDQRGQMGALQNRLDHTVNNLTTASENTTAANSRIRDTDMAKEMMAYTSKNVIAQAAQSMLAQANSQPQNVLSLLQ